MRICFITSTYPRNAGDGIGAFVRRLAETLVSLGHEVCVVAPDDPAVAPMDHAGVEVHRFRYPPWNDRYLIGHARGMVADERLTRLAPLLLPGFVVCGLAKLLALHRRRPFDLLHGHWLLPGGFMAAVGSYLTGRPAVIGEHGSGVYFARKHRAYGLVARFALRRARQIVACSPNLRDGTLALGLEPERVTVIPYGVDAARFGRGDAELASAALRQRLGLPEGARVVGAIGRLASKKGFDRLLAAMPAVLAAAPDAYCVIAGDGDLAGELRQQAATLGLGQRAIFAGQLPWETTAAFYALCDVLTIPSVADPGGNVDGLPNVLLEGMASGRAVVASRVAGIPTVVQDGRNGLLVPPGDAPALAGAILRLLDEPQRRGELGREAQRWVAERHSWLAHTQAMLEVYERALQGAPQRRS